MAGSVDALQPNRPATVTDLSVLIDRGMNEIVFGGTMLGRLSDYEPPPHVILDVHSFVEKCQTHERGVDVVRLALINKRALLSTNETPLFLLLHVLAELDFVFGRDSMTLQKKVWTELAFVPDYCFVLGSFQGYQNDIARLVIRNRGGDSERLDD